MLVHTRRGYDLWREWGSASCDIIHETKGAVCDGHWNLRLVISLTRQGVRFVTGIGFCVLSYHTQDRGYDLLRELGSASCDNRDNAYVLFRALLSASCKITHETGGTICCGHRVLRLVITHTRQEVRFDTGIGFCVL